jgi:hypothetical protein
MADDTAPPADAPLTFAERFTGEPSQPSADQARPAAPSPAGDQPFSREQKALMYFYSEARG